jgi:transcription antitermination factor NusG
MGTLVSTTLRGKGYEEFLPLYASRKRWSDRIKQCEKPLFPGYLFCRFDLSVRLAPVLTTPGVISIVGAGHHPTPIPDEEIEAVRRIIRSGLPALPWPGLSIGSRVYIRDGPLTGLDGIITETDKVYRLVVSVTLLQRSVAVKIDREWAGPIAQRPTSSIRTSNAAEGRCST